MIKYPICASTNDLMLLNLSAIAMVGAPLQS